MTLETDARHVLAAYPSDCQPTERHFLGSAGGFSGAQLWRLTTPRGKLCLRRWPQEYPSVDQLEFMQAVLWHVDQEGFDLVPVPLETRQRAGYVEQGGHLWELTPWMPGTADFHLHPSPQRLSAAMQALARFHQAAASFPLPEAEEVSLGIQARLARLRELAGEKRASLLALAAASNRWPELAARGRRLGELFVAASRTVENSLAQAVELRAPLLPCLRDIWHDHVLFVGDQVSGLIDFGAMRPEVVAADVSRLLGSLAADNAQAWTIGLSSYEKVRPLSCVEAVLVTAFDRANVLLSGFNWLTWYYEEHREFDNPLAVLARVDHYLQRLTNLAANC
jgi:Ser/Thr protein kinase RdoA (MazF antagonist)